jgi:hypothetical protein
LLHETTVSDKLNINAEEVDDDDNNNNIDEVTSKPQTDESDEISFSDSECNGCLYTKLTKTISKSTNKNTRQSKPISEQKNSSGQYTSHKKVANLPT